MRRLAAAVQRASPVQGHSATGSRLQRISFGGPAAIVTSTGLIVGLHTATVGKAAIAGSLLILALADNLTDSLGVHIYQGSERLPPREAFRTTVANFLTRLLLALSFVALVLIVPSPQVVYVSIVWGLTLLAALSVSIARLRRVSAVSEICEHCAVALAVVALSQLIGMGIRLWVGQA
jgi:vacuolar iron transporter family protein